MYPGVILKCTIAVVLLFITTLLPAQNQAIQKLETQLEQEAVDTARIDLMVKLSGLYAAIDKDKSYFYAEEALSKSRNINYQKGVAYALNKKALYYNKLGNKLKSLELNTEAIKIGRLIDDDRLMSRILNNLGYAYFNLGMNEKAIEHYFEAIPYVTNKDDDNVHVIVLENISNVFIDIGDNQKSNEYSKRALEVAEKSTDSLLHYIPHLYKANQANVAENYQEAELHYNAALETTYIYNHKAWVLRKHAISLVAQNKLTSALSKIKEAIKLYEEKSDIERIIDTKLEHIQILNELSRYDTSLKVVSELMTNYKEVNTQNADLLELYKASAFAHQKLGNYKKANEHNLLTFAFKDSIFNEQKIKTANSLDVKYNLTEKEQENNQLRSQQEKSALIASQQKKTVAFTSILLFLALIISLLLYRANAQKNKFNDNLEKEVNLKTEALQKSNLELKQSNIELERFAYITSHDLKEPLRNITSFSQLIDRNLKSNYSKAKLFEYSQFIQSNAKQMNSLIEGILFYSREGATLLPQEEINVAELIADAEKLLHTEIKNSNAEINLQGPIPNITSYRTQLLIVFQNLISNGIKYNESPKPQIDISYSKRDGYHQFSVKDNGIGIDYKYKDYIFEMFNRLHNRSNYEGSGLGLSICQKFIESKGGKIWLGQPASGSQIFFTLPVVTPMH